MHSLNHALHTDVVADEVLVPDKEHNRDLLKDARKDGNGRVGRAHGELSVYATPTLHPLARNPVCVDCGYDIPALQRKVGYVSKKAAYDPDDAHQGTCTLRQGPVASSCRTAGRCPPTAHRRCSRIGKCRSPCYELIARQIRKPASTDVCTYV